MNERVRTRVLLSACLVAILCAAAPYEPKQPLDAAVRDCKTLSACLRAVDANIQTDDQGCYCFGNDSQISAAFQQFGEPARRALVRRATGRHIAWRHLADQVLQHWPGWAAADVPVLRRILRANPNGYVAHVLGDIGTPEAIAALVEDAKLDKDGPGQTGDPLQKLRDAVAPYMLYIPEGGRPWDFAGSAISEMTAAKAEPILAFWLSAALDTKQPIARRIAVLQGLIVVSENVHDLRNDISGKLHPLLNDSDIRIRAEAVELMRSTFDPIMHDPAILPRLVEACNPTADPFGMAPFWSNCLEEIAAFDQAARPFAPTIAGKFLNAPNAAERSDAASVVAFLDYRPAVPRLIEMLGEKEWTDWRVVYAAARAVGWLGAKEAIPALDHVAQDYWLPQVRERAQTTASALKLDRTVPRPDALTYTDGDLYKDNLRIDLNVLEEVPNCENGYEWQGTPIRFPDDVPLEESLAAFGGTFTRVNRGEFGGGLTFKPRFGRTTELVHHNTSGVALANDGLVAVVDRNAVFATGDSYAAHVFREPGGKWQVEKIGQLPTGAFGLAALGPDLFATWGFSNSLRVVVFNSQRILGLASCIQAP